MIHDEILNSKVVKCFFQCLEFHKPGFLVVFFFPFHFFLKKGVFVIFVVIVGLCFFSPSHHTRFLW